MKKILIIGCGSIGERHLRCFQKSKRAEVVGCEPDAGVRNRIASDYCCKVFGDIEAAFEAGGWDGVVICTPAHLHLRNARLFLKTEIPLLIEKPLATDLEEAELFLRDFHSKKDTLRVAYINRSVRGINQCKRILQESNFGPLKHITLCAGQHFPSFRPAYRNIYYARHETGGGAIQDALTHSINTVEWIAGPIESLYCDAAHQVLEGVNVEDTVNLVSRHHGGVMTSFALNQFQAPNSMVLDCHCAGGSVRWDAERQQVGKIQLGETSWQWNEAREGDRDEAFVHQANLFIDHIEGKPTALCTLDEGFQTLQVNLAALESMRTGRKVVL